MTDPSPNARSHNPVVNPVDCPVCGRPTGLPIRYGMPGPELIEDAEAGRVVLGGCMITENADTRHCTGCGHRLR